MKPICLVVLLSWCLSAAPGDITVKHLNPLVPDTPYNADQLQDAIDDPLTTCGDIIEINPGGGRVDINPYILRGPGLDPSLGGPLVRPSYAKDCAASGKYITIRSSQTYQLTPGKRVGAGDVANLAFAGHGILQIGDLIYPSFGCAIFETEMAASYWRLQGLEMSPAPTDCSSGGHALIKIDYTEYGGSSALARLDQFPHHIVIDQCWIHGIDSHPVRDGIAPDGRLVTISNSTIENLRVGQIPDATNESHGISMERSRQLRIINNKISGQAMDVIAGGANIIGTRRGSEYVDMQNNWLYKQYKLLDWAGTVDPTPSSPCPVDSDGHGATYKNSVSNARFECQGAEPGTWTSISSGTHDALVATRVSGGYQKNVIEFKRMRNFHMEGNVSDRSSPFTFDNQLGTCLLLSLVDGPSGSDEDLLVENNICRHAGWGFRTSSDLETGGLTLNPGHHNSFWTNGGRALHNIVVRNNYYHHMGESMYTNPGFGHKCFDAAPPGNTGAFSCSSGFTTFVNNIADAVTVDHNTFESRTSGNVVTVNNYVYNNGFRMDRGYLSAGIPSDNLNYNTLDSINQRVTNNLITSSLRAIAGGSGGNDNNGVASLWGPHAEIASNAFIDNLNLGTSYGGGYNPVDGVIYHCTQGTLGCPYADPITSYPPNCLGNGGSASLSLRPGACKYGVPSALGFTSYPDDLTLQTTSPLKAAGLDGKDLGADLNTVGWATAGAEAGTMAPYLAMKIRLIRPASTSALVRFSAIDTSSCTVAARVYGLPLSSPVSTVTDSSGKIDRSVTLTGLVSGTHYGLKVTCAGSYYREDEFRTP